ncbi:MAG: hypothetical protein WC725_05555 [Patescibacteria group bacterium]|jgi:hypothetical protein
MPTEIWLRIQEVTPFVTGPLADDEDVIEQLVGATVPAKVISPSVEQGDLFTRQFSPVPQYFLIEPRALLAACDELRVIFPDTVDQLREYYQTTGFSEIQVRSDSTAVRQILADVDAEH